MTDEHVMPQYDGMEYEELVAAAQFLWLENAKLRRLARGLNWCTENAKVPSAECEHCPLGDTFFECGELSCEKLMRELRIEV